MIIGISRDEAESLGLSLSHRRQVGGLSVFYRLLSGLLSGRSLIKIRKNKWAERTTSRTAGCYLSFKAKLAIDRDLLGAVMEEVFFFLSTLKCGREVHINPPSTEVFGGTPC